MKFFQIFFSCVFLIGLINNQKINGQIRAAQLNIMGTIQDGGSPHIGCEKKCCKFISEKDRNKRFVSSLSLVDLESDNYFLFEATPDIEKQLRILNNNYNKQLTLYGIFLTHAHIGHYSGLMYLGKEALGANKVPVFAMPKMSHFLRNNGPWSQLVDDQNIVINQMSRNFSN